MKTSSATTLVEILRAKVEQSPHLKVYTFLVDGEREDSSLTYAELDRQAQAIGALLQQYQARGERVLLLYPPGLDYIAAFFGCLYAGAIAVPAYPPRNARHLPRIKTIAEDSQAGIWLTVEKIKARIQAWLEQTPGLTANMLLSTDTLTAEFEAHWRAPEVQSYDIAFLQYTSGSTALPKGVMVTHGNILRNSELIQRAFEHTSESRAVSWLPPYHDMGLIGGILQPLFVGFPVVLMTPATFLQRPVRWLQAISQYRATTSGGPNFAYDLCVSKITAEQREKLDLSNWDLAFNGAEPVRSQTLHDFASKFAGCGFRREAFYPCYGLAEATLFVAGGKKSEPPNICTFQGTALEQGQVAKASSEEANGRTLTGCGQMLPEQKLVIVDPQTFTICPPLQIGEFWISGPNVPPGYWNHPEKTGAIFQATLSDTGEGPFLRTGDLGFLKDGELFITGRMKDLIIIRGRNHYPQDIELTVEHSEQHLRRNSSAAFSIDVNGEEQLVIVAELERRYIYDVQQARKANRSERRHQQEPEYEVKPGFTEDILCPPHIRQCLTCIQEAVAEHHGVQVHAIVLIKPLAIPRTSSGKIQRYACRMAFQAGSLGSLAEWRTNASQNPGSPQSVIDIVSPETESSSSPEHSLTGAWDVFIARLWAETLNIDWTRLTHEAHFFQLGGDSLHATTITGTFSDALGVELDTDLLYQYSTLGALAMYFEQHFGMPPSDGAQNTLLLRYQKHCRPESSDFRLLPLQQSFFIGRAVGDIAIYVVLDVELKGTLHLKLFQEAMQLLVKRHPALRLAFKSTPDGPAQYIQSPVNAGNVVRLNDLSHLAPEERWKFLEQERDALTRHTFDNSAGETFRATLFTINAQTSRLMINVDHLAIDGFSLTKFFQDLHWVYAQLLQQKSVAETPQTSLGFKEYIEIYHAAQDVAQRERDIAYWMVKFATHDPFPPIGRELSEMPEHDGFKTHFGFLDAALIQQLHEHARTYGVTFFSLLMAAFFKLFSYWTHTQCLTINTPHLNRRPYAHDVQEILGCFTDILPIKAENIADETLIHLACNIHQSLAELHHHASISGVEIARLLAQQHHTNPQAVSPLIFSSALFPLEEMSSAFTYTFSSIWVQTGAPATWLDVVVYENGGELVCSWNYWRKKFSQEKITLLAIQYEAILNDFVEHPESADPLRVLLRFPDFASWYEHRQQHEKQERHQILVEWNDTAVEYPLDTCIHTLIETQVERTPEAVAVLFENRQMTYRELNARANQLAHHLRSLGVGREALVGIAVERSFEMVIGLLGILKAGGAYVPIDPEYPKERLAFMLEDSQVPVLLTQEKFLPELPVQQTRMLCLDRDWDIIAREREENPDSGVTAENLIYVIYTSGSTGKPKGAMNIHRALVNRLLWMQDAYELTPEDRVLQKTPCSFDVSGWEFWWPLLAGSRLIIAKPGGHKDSAYLVKLIQQHGITTMHFVPPMLQVFLEERNVEQCTSLRQVICSGEALPYSLQERFFERLGTGIALHNLYGPTEAAIDVTFWQCRPGDSRKLVPIGRPIANTQMYILDPQLQPVPLGTPGELHIGGVNLARGYWNRPELTQEKFIPDPFSHNPEARLYKTGDLVQYLPDGNIEYLGRLDHQVKIRGFRIELGEIEAVLSSYPDIREATVLVREVAGEKRLAAYIVPNQQPGPSVRELRDFLKEQLPEYMVPAAFVSLDAFPLSPNGKIDRKALPNPEQQEAEEAYVAPRTPTEQQLADMWAELLGVERVGIENNFFELGGHSLMAAQVASRVRETFGIELPLTAFFDVPTVAGLAEMVVSAQLEETDTDGLEQILAEMEGLADEDIVRQLSEDA